MENGEMARFDIKINLSVRKVEQLNTTDPSNRGCSRCKVSELSNIQWNFLKVSRDLSKFILNLSSDIGEYRLEIRIFSDVSKCVSFMDFDWLVVNWKLFPHSSLLDSPDTWYVNSTNVQLKSIQGIERDTLYFAFITFKALASSLPFSVFSALLLYF